MDAERIWEKCLCPRIKATEPVSGCGRWLVRYCVSLKCSVLGEFEAGTWLLWRRELWDKCQAVTMWPYHASPNETKSYFLREETANNQIRVGNRCHKFHRLSQSLWQNLTFYTKKPAAIKFELKVDVTNSTVCHKFCDIWYKTHCPNSIWCH